MGLEVAERGDRAAEATGALDHAGRDSEPAGPSVAERGDFTIKADEIAIQHGRSGALTLACGDGGPEQPRQPMASDIGEVAPDITSQIASWLTEAEYWLGRSTANHDVNWVKGEGLRRCAGQLECLWIAHLSDVQQAASNAVVAANARLVGAYDLRRKTEKR